MSAALHYVKCMHQMCNYATLHQRRCHSDCADIVVIDPIVTVDCGVIVKFYWWDLPNCKITRASPFIRVRRKCVHSFLLTD